MSEELDYMAKICDATVTLSDLRTETAIVNTLCNRLFWVACFELKLGVRTRTVLTSKARSVSYTACFRRTSLSLRSLFNTHVRNINGIKIIAS